MQKWKILIDIDALSDIEDPVEWYNMQSSGLGTRFRKQVSQQVNLLKTNPEAYRVRYLNVRCMLIEKFPFLVHFTIDNNSVNIFAVFHTS
jgi:hypothetical protein